MNEYCVKELFVRSFYYSNLQRLEPPMGIEESLNSKLAYVKHGISFR